MSADRVENEVKSKSRGIADKSAIKAHLKSKRKNDRGEGTIIDIDFEPRKRKESSDSSKQDRQRLGSRETINPATGKKGFSKDDFSVVVSKGTMKEEFRRESEDGEEAVGNISSFLSLHNLDDLDLAGTCKVVSVMNLRIAS